MSVAGDNLISRTSDEGLAVYDRVWQVRNSLRSQLLMDHTWDVGFFDALNLAGRSMSVVNGESKSEFLQRIQREGLHAQFEADRKILKEMGQSPGEAWLRLRSTAPYLKVEKKVALPFKVRDIVDDGREVKLPPMVAPIDIEKAKEEYLNSSGNEALSMAAEVQWVYRVMNTPLDAIDLTEAPSIGAVGLLEWAVTSTTTRTEFYKVFVQKLLPSRAELESSGRYFDDSRKIFAKLEAFERSFDRG